MLVCPCASAQTYDPSTQHPRSADESVLEILRVAKSQREHLGPYTVTRRYTLCNGHLKSATILQVMWTYKPGVGKQFKVLSSQGSSGLAQRALMEVLETEAKNSRLKTDPSSITLDHYSFELAASEQNNYKLRLTPRHKNKYLVNGYALVKESNNTIVRVEGRTSKRLSFWVSNADVVQEFANYAGFWLPSKTQSTANVRFAGKVDLTIEAGDYDFARRVSSTLRHLAWEFSDFLPLSFGRLAPAC